MKTLLRDESGQTLIFVAVSMTVILGFLAMAADVGTLLHDRRNLQIAADSAAIAGAVEEKVSLVTGDIQASGQTASTQNGFTNGANGVTVTINTPPANGPHTGAAGYVEAIVSQAEPLFFTKLRGFTTMTVTTRAVAFDGATSTNCVLATNLTAPQTIELQGSFNANFPKCSVVDDSNDPDALDFTGGGGSLTAGSVGVVGGAGGHTGDSTPAPKTGIAPISDPLGSLPPPPYNPASCTAAPTGTVWGQATAGVTVCYSGNIKVQQNIMMNAGIYVFTGDLDFTGNGSLTSLPGGVTLYFAGPNGQLGGPGNGNTTLDLTATSTGGPYNHILIYQDRTDANLAEFNGTPITNLTGIIYIPDAPLEFSGNTVSNLTTDLIVNQLIEQGNATVNITNFNTTVNDSPLTTVALVE
jgi:hypothetical protein